MTVDDTLNEAAQFVRNYMADTLARYAGEYESPIEQKFVAGLLACGAYRTENDTVHLRYRGHKLSDPPEQIFGVLCYPQVVIGPYRVDFVLRRGTDVVVVECDGHAFHNQTKAQVTRDRRRDRNFTALRIPVLRYTGSEINASPLNCAMGALDVLLGVRINV